MATPLTRAALSKTWRISLARRTLFIQPTRTGDPFGHPPHMQPLWRRQIRVTEPPKQAQGEQNLYLFYALLGATTLGFIYNIGGPYPGEDGQKDRENHPDEGFLDGFIRRSRERCGAIQSAATSPILDKLLPDPTQGPNQPRLTLVINLDYTLIHSAWTKEHGWRIAKRPGVDQFLSKLSQHYELVIFTTQTSSNAERILEKLDPQHQVRYLLDRDSTRLVNGKYVKDLSYLNRDLSNVIIMDSNPESHSLQPENAIAMEPWEGDPNDTRLMAMIPILEAMATSDESDVRVLLAKYQGRITSQA